MIFFGALICAIVYVYFFVPEVKGLSLEEIDELYRSKVKPWQSASWVPSGGRYAHKKDIKMSEKRDSSGEGSLKEEVPATREVV